MIQGGESANSWPALHRPARSPSPPREPELSWHVSSPEQQNVALQPPFPLPGAHRVEEAGENSTRTEGPGSQQERPPDLWVRPLRTAHWPSHHAAEHDSCVQPHVPLHRSTHRSTVVALSYQLLE